MGGSKFRWEETKEARRPGKGKHVQEKIWETLYWGPPVFQKGRERNTRTNQT